MNIDTFRISPKTAGEGGIYEKVFERLQKTVRRWLQHFDDDRNVQDKQQILMQAVGEYNSDEKGNS